MEPLRGGNLGNPQPPPAVEAIWETAEKRRTPAEWALRWVWNHPEVKVVLSGMNIDEHIVENLAIADQAEPRSLTSQECEIVDQVAARYKELMAVNCTGCGYCLPCPEGVMIPSIFEVYNNMHLFGNHQEAKFVYAARTSGVLTGGTAGFASACVKCGECLEKCPQQIEIPDVLEDVVDVLEGPGLEGRLAAIGKMFKAET